MRLILVGCEYAGTTTLAEEIVKWRDRVMGPPTPLGIVTYHDHFTPPWFDHWDGIPEEDLKKYMDLGPVLKEMFTRYQFAYHLSPQLYRDSDHILIGFHIEEAVYAPSTTATDARGSTATVRAWRAASRRKSSSKGRTPCSSTSRPPPT